MYHIVVDLGGKKPPTKHRPRFGKGHAYKTDANRDWENKIAHIWREKYGQCKLDGYLYLAVYVYFPVNKRDALKTKENKLLNKLRPNKKPDADNTLKLVADALNGVAYTDDQQITTMYCTKRYDKQSRLEIFIAEDKNEKSDIDNGLHTSGA